MLKMKKIQCLFLLVLFVPIASAANVEILFDSSGSMSNSLLSYQLTNMLEKNLTFQNFAEIINMIGQYKPKIDIAKEAMISYVNSSEPGQQIGFRKFGFGESEDLDADCKSTESLVAISPLNAQNLIEKINNIQAVGKRTPISYALNESINDFSNITGMKTIILVSDGEENCGEDPCNTAKELKEKGIDVVVDAVGVAISDEGAEQLRCIANITGGRYYGISKEQELKDLFAYNLPVDTGITSIIKNIPTPKNTSITKILFIAGVIVLIGAISFVVFIVLIIKLLTPKPVVSA